MLSHPRQLSRRNPQHGLSLVELMVGIAVGMFIVAAASTLVATQLSDNRRLMLELQVQQDIRATADIITRAVRRIGSAGVGGITYASFPIWAESGGSSVDIEYNRRNLTGTNQVEYWFPRDPSKPGPFGFRSVIGTTSGVIQSQFAVSDGGWTDLTDSNAVRITEFKLTPVDEPAIQLSCPKLCSSASPPDKSCWPTVQVRALKIEITGVSKSDPTVVRSIRSVAKLRNDIVKFNVDPTDTNTSCPP